MASRARLEAAAVVAAYGFGGHHRIVDVGGGRGVLLAAILAAHPGAYGVLLDRPDAARLAADTLAAAAPAESWDVVGGDFFDEVPTGGDLYVLSRVLHDWDDASATAILRTCRRAADPGTSLAVVEAVLPEKAADGPAAIRMDLHMLALFDGGRERTAAEYAALLDAAGFALVDVVPTGSPSGIGVLSARAV
jgi:hypothetical protein